MKCMRTMLVCAMMTTGVLLCLDGRAQEAIPLHLCSVSAFAALALTLGAGDGALDFLWYLGMPGALLALLFPAPAVSAHQALMTAAYVLTHALILAIPAYALFNGRRIRRGKSLYMFALVHALACIAYPVNVCLSTDFLFLMAPPAGTPLEAIFRQGALWYALSLEALCALLLLVTGTILPRMCPKLMK